jgi:hypothetical protein
MEIEAKMQKQKPNHICKNPGCHKGENGQKKEYYVCNHCVEGKPIFWKMYCCSEECFQEWIKYRNKNSEQKVTQDPPVLK